MKAEIYLDRTQRFQARIGVIPRTGHAITEDSGLFHVGSILIGDGPLCLNATRSKAETLIASEWEIFTSTRTPQTSRERDLEFNTIRRERRLADMFQRNFLAEQELRPRLRPGDRLRATKAECGSREASFTFSHWYGGWIVSNGGSSIAPSSVYSINGKVLRV